MVSAICKANCLIHWKSVIGNRRCRRWESLYHQSCVPSPVLTASVTSALKPPNNNSSTKSYNALVGNRRHRRHRLCESGIGNHRRRRAINPAQDLNILLSLARE
ncbi:hypothetical protein G9A89_000590 [Geosiphon pyriformis]|nr:hypothetical protein G9A89_000590 [Geosiphon pyriformis]